MYLNFENLLLIKEENIGILSINRPDTLNSLNSELLKELDKAIDFIKQDEEIYVLIITGEGKAFVAGADIGEMKDLAYTEAKEFAELGMNVFRKIELLDIPTIAAVNGFALGGGCELAMSCDIRIASERAKFGQPEVGLGITPGFAGTQRLPRLVGLPIAKELIFTGDIIDAKKAYEIHLVNKVVPSDQLLEESKALATKIAQKGQIAVRYAKEAIRISDEMDIEQGMEIESDLFAKCFDTEDQKEGMTAFLERRTPNFKLK